MHVKMNTRYAGPKGACEPGQVIELPESEAAPLIAGRYAVEVDAPVEAPAAEPDPVADEKPAPDPLRSTHEPAPIPPKRKRTRGGKASE